MSACDRGDIDVQNKATQDLVGQLQQQLEQLEFRVYTLEKKMPEGASESLSGEDLERRRQKCLEERGDNNMLCLSLP